MTKSPKTIKDFHWVTIEQSGEEWNEFFINFNIPSYEFSVREPLPKNTAVRYILPSIGFLCKFVRFNPNRLPKSGSVRQVFKKIFDKICGFLEKQVREELKENPRINYSDVSFSTDYVTFDEKSPSEMEGWLRGVVFIHLRPSANSSEIKRILFEVDEVYEETKVISEAKRLLRELLKGVGFTLEDCTVNFSEHPKVFPMMRTIGFYYLPRTLDEWKEKEIDTLHFLISFPKSKKVIKAFKEMILSCQTISELSKQVPLFVSMFRDKTRVLRVQVLPSDSHRMWLISAEVGEENDVLCEDAYPFLRNTFIWVKRVVDGDNPFQNEKLTGDNSLVETEVRSHNIINKGG